MDATQEDLLRTLLLQLLHTHVGPGGGYGMPAPAHQMIEGTGVKVQLELDGMVRRMVRQVWVDNASIASQIGEELRRQMSEVSLEQEIAKAVRRVLSDLRARIDRVIHDAAMKVVTEVVHAKLKTFPEWVANKMAANIWGDVHDLAEARARRKRRIRGD